MRFGLPSWQRLVRWVAQPGALTLFALAGHAIASDAPLWLWKGLPQDAAPPPVPADNAMSDAKVALGRMLFYEPALSSDGTLPCAGCHQQAHGFSDGLPTHTGVTGDQGIRNVPGLANVAWRTPLTWADPKILTLEQQALVPMTGEAPVEMGMHGQAAALAQRLAASACYKDMFARAFPERAGAIDVAAISQALSAFERTLISASSPYDRFRAGDDKALSAQARSGAALFAKIGCADCHSGPDLTDNALHYTGTEDQNEHCGYGMRDCSDQERPTSSFRTPSLRNVAVTGPWLHDGASKTIEDAIRRHAANQLVGVDIAAITAFLDAQTDRAFLTDARFAKPAQACTVPVTTYRVAARN